MMRASIFYFAVLFLATSNPAFSQLDTQNSIEIAIHEVTLDYRNQIYEHDNAIRKIQLYEDWYERMQEFTFMGEELEFTGLVWSVDFDTESSTYVLRIGSHNET